MMLYKCFGIGIVSSARQTRAQRSGRANSELLNSPTAAKYELTDAPIFKIKSASWWVKMGSRFRHIGLLFVLLIIAFSISVEPVFAQGDGARRQTVLKVSVLSPLAQSYEIGYERMVSPSTGIEATAVAAVLPARGNVVDIRGGSLRLMMRGYLNYYEYVPEGLYIGGVVGVGLYFIDLERVTSSGISRLNTSSYKVNVGAVIGRQILIGKQNHVSIDPSLRIGYGFRRSASYDEFLENDIIRSQTIDSGFFLLPNLSVGYAF